ncbi:hypothetical protein LJC49_06770 [Ruminococcaceae bacterium OttesenSCG-928-I18]|nr:hypothetical protein [Ruminococcaceae bacterium OttesenSCG-928-I18]
MQNHMMAKLKKESLKRALPLVVLFVLLGLVSLAAGGHWVLRALAGPEEISAFSPNDLEGRYLQAEISTVVDEYAYIEQRMGDADEGRVVGREYMIYTPSGEYVLGLLVQGDELSRLEASLSHLIEDGQFASPVTITGTVVPMDAESIALFDELLQYHAISEGNAVHSLLVAGALGTLSQNTTYVLFFATVLLLLLGVALLVAALSGAFQGAVRRYIRSGDAPRDVLRQLDARNGAYSLGKAWFYPFAVLYQSGFFTRLLDAEDLVWIYLNGGKGEVVLATAQGRRYTVNPGKTEPEQALYELFRLYPWVYKGYSEEAQRLYERDPELLAQDGVDEE